MIAGPVAVIDIGSGAAKLLVADGEQLARGGPDLVHEVVKTGPLAGGGRRVTDQAPAAVAAAFDAFDVLLADHRPAAMAVVGTAWTRQVDSIAPLQELVAARYGVDLEALDGPREATLAYAGAVAGRPLAGPVAVVDIGAGSTEFAIGGDGGQPVGLSLPIGARTVTEHYLASDPPRADELSSALSVIELHLDDLRRELPGFGAAVDAGTVIGAGATGTIAEVEIGLADPDAQSVDGYRLVKPAVEEVFRTLATESADDRAHNPGLRPRDVDDIVGALCIAVELLRQFAVDEVVVSARGVMHGRAAELAASS